MTKNIAYALLIFGVCVSLFVFNVFIVAVGDNIKAINYGYMMQSHVLNNELSFPFPNSQELIDSNIYLDRYAHKEHLVNLPLNDFIEELRFVYQKYYEEDTYDCKYWAYVWTLYYQENKDRYGWTGIKYLDTPNHIVPVIYSENKYCLMDGDMVMCRSLE